MVEIVNIINNAQKFNLNKLRAFNTPRDAEKYIFNNGSRVCEIC